MLMVSNPNLPIHSRLWCVFEAHCARSFGIPTTIAGNPEWLVKDADRDRAATIMRDYAEGLVGGRHLEQMIAELALDVNQAACFSVKDKALIWEEIGNNASLINIMIKEQMLSKFVESRD